jgi:hypothetical protein
MAISGELTNELVAILKIYLTDSKDCIAYLRRLLGTEENVSGKVSWDKKSNYLPDIIYQLDIFGNLDSGQIALCGFLTLISEELGEDVQGKINKLGQKIVKEQAICKLKNILEPLEKKYFQQIQQSYSVCLSGNFSDWLPDNVESIFNQFIHEREDSFQSIAFFVARLLIIHKFPHDINHELENWGRNHVDNFHQICQQTKQDIKQKQDNIQRYLIILIEPSIQETDKSLYIVKSWVIEEDNLRYKSLDITDQKKEKFSFKEMPSLLSYFIEQSIQELKNLPTTIEFFLPYELFSQPIDAFIPQELEEEDDEEELLFPVGIKYQVSIRSYQRIKKLLKKKYPDEKILLWQKKWETLHSKREEICCSCLTSADNLQEIVRELFSDDVIGVKSSQIPSKDILKAIDQTGTPIALWLRTESQNLDFMPEFEAFLQDCSITELPKRIKDKRLEAFRQEIHIGKHITLLWDNPNILPPHILPASLPEVLH